MSTCAKLAYDSKERARRALIYLMKNKAREMRKDRRPMHVYACPRCGYWHFGHVSSEMAPADPRRN